MSCPLLVVSLVGMATMTPVAAFVVPQHLPNVPRGAARQSMTLSYASDSALPLGSDRKYVRLVPRTVRGSRQCFEVQTAMTTFERTLPEGGKQQVDLHAQLHFGDQDYFDYYNSDEFGSQYDGVLYELVIDDSMVQNDENGLRYLPRGGNGIMASPTDQQTASQYGLTCQVNAIEYARPKWIHADLTRQEILEQTDRRNQQRQEPSLQEPIWALASSAPTWPGAEAISALFRPSTPSTPLSTPVTRRLFSNLFLPGNALAGLLRALFWVLVPSPELSVMLLDWSSILPRPTGGVSQVALPVVQSLLTGNHQEARQLVFGQMIVSGQSSSSNEKVLIGKRNEHAVNVLSKCLNKENGQKYALLYGGMHCPDLQQRLTSMGFNRVKTQWRTAWSVQVPSFGTGTSSQGETFAATSSSTAIAIGLVILPLYFCIGGLDWISTIREVASSVDAGSMADALFVLGLYLVRHVMLYLGLSKFVVEWDGRNLFDTK